MVGATGALRVITGGAGCLRAAGARSGGATGFCGSIAAEGAGTSSGCCGNGGSSTRIFFDMSPGSAAFLPVSKIFGHQPSIAAMCTRIEIMIANPKREIFNVRCVSRIGYN